MIYIYFLLSVSAILLYFYWWLKEQQKFFERNGIPYPKPFNLLFGHMTNVILLRTTILENYKNLHDALEPHKFGGVYFMHKPTILIRDPELIKRVLVKDFNYFHGRGVKVHRDIEPLMNLINHMEGNEWKMLRTILNPFFSPSKLKMMFPIINDCGVRLRNVIEKFDPEDSFDVQDLVARFTINVIGVCAYGFDINSLDHPKTEFRKMGEKLFDVTFPQVLRGIWPTMPKQLIKAFNLKLIERNLSNYFINLIEDAMKYREMNNIKTNDFLGLILQAKNNFKIAPKKFNNEAENINNSSDFEITTDIIAANSVLFFAAGYHTSGTTITTVIFELAQNMELQNKVRKEIEMVLQNHNNQITYEALHKLTYMDMVISEAIRKYPPAGVILRECMENYRIPETNVIIPAKTPVLISTNALHMDPKYFEKPNEFYPEHFTEEAKANRPHFAYLPFGEGPRICLGQRFGKIIVKIGLINMLQNFSYQLSPEMKLPLEYMKNFGFLQIKNEILVKRKRIR